MSQPAEQALPEELFLFKESDFIFGRENNYLIEKFLGQGTFGKVARCIRLGTKERVAVKIVRKDLFWAGKHELQMLKKLRALDEDRNNLVKCIDYFRYKGYICLAFDMLDTSLYDFMKMRRFRPLQVSEIRVISQQMLVALNGLKKIGLVHTDIKPDNIMLVNHVVKPFKLKLIDFGLAGPISSLRRGTLIQALGYRAPEVILGLPLTEAVDMWAVGCVLAFMYLGQHLYPTQCEYEVMRVIVQMHGQPDDHLLNSGVSTKNYFCKDKSSSGSWRLKTRAEYKCPEGNEAKHCSGVFDMFTCLNDMAKTQPKSGDPTEQEDTQAFLSLLRRMLHVDPEKRISPSEALGHRFITMKHLPKVPEDNSYAEYAHMVQSESQMEQSSVSTRYVTSSEVVSLDGLVVASFDSAELMEESELEKNATAGNNAPTAPHEEVAPAQHKEVTPVQPNEVQAKELKSVPDKKPTQPEAVTTENHKKRTQQEKVTLEHHKKRQPEKVTLEHHKKRQPEKVTLEHHKKRTQPEKVTPTQQNKTTQQKAGMPAQQNKTTKREEGTPTQRNKTTKREEGTPTHGNKTKREEGRQHKEASGSRDEEVTLFVEVKSRKKWLKRIQNFFSRMMKPSRCCKESDLSA